MTRRGLLGLLLVLGLGCGRVLGAAAETAGQPLEVYGRVIRSVTAKPVRSGTVELRWPGHDDLFAPVQTSLREDGTYEFQVEVPERVPAGELTVTVMAKGFTLEEKPLAPDGGTVESPVGLNVVLSASTLDGVLDIFSCCILTWGVLTVMLPAFLLGGAVKAFVPGAVLLRYLGPKAPQPVAYGAATLTGMVLSLCSCNVIPLFMSVWRSGAGLGPAFAFLYAGPAISVVGTLFTCRVIGFGIGLWRTISVLVIALVVGVVMAAVFGRTGAAARQDEVEAVVMGPSPKPAAATIGLVLVLLVLGSLEMTVRQRLAVTLPVAVVTAAVAFGWLERDYCWLWLRESGVMVLKIVPILVPAVFLIGLLAQQVPLSATRWLTGSNSLAVNASAATFGSLMYFPILTETAFVKSLLKVMGMNTGPAMALLLTGPGLSLPGMIILWREIGLKKLAVYVTVVISMATLAGWFFGSQWGSYLCNCEFK